MGLEGREKQMQARLAILDQRMSVRTAEAFCEKLKSDGSATPTAPPKAEASPTAMRLTQAAQTISRQWASKVEIKGNGKRGKIVFHYGSREDLDRLLQGMQKYS
jgi:ParB-like chromosome segregation protein Spo0J